MGIQTEKIYFENGMPDEKSICKIFYDITGLELQIKENPYEDDGLSYYVEGFYRLDLVDFYYEGKCFYLEAPIGSYYFFYALLETFFKLGARKVNHRYNYDRNVEELPNLDIHDYLLPISENKYWEDLKKWKDYDLFKRPKK